MIEIGGKRFFKPSEVAKYGLIVNSKGESEYRFVLRLIHEGTLEARVWNSETQVPYYMVPEEEIVQYNRQFNEDYEIPEEVLHG